MPNLAKLREEHAQLVEIVHRLGVLTKRPSPPPQVELFNVRRELNSVLIAHLKAEDWLLYPRLMASGDSGVAAVARTFSEEMGGLSAAVAGYNNRWDAESIDQDWPGYCRETHGIIEALIHRVTRENRELYPLLEQLDKAA